MSDFSKVVCEKIAALPPEDTRPAILLVNGVQQSVGTLVIEGGMGRYYPVEFGKVPHGKVTLRIMDSGVSYECSRFEACPTGSPHFHFGVAAQSSQLRTE